MARVQYGPEEWDRISTENIPPYRVYKLPIVKSERDDREYRVIKLENGMEATLVHDAKAERAAASLNVAVGSLSDPVSTTDSLICPRDMYCSLSRMICQEWRTSASTCFFWYVCNDRSYPRNAVCDNSYILGY